MVNFLGQLLKICYHTQIKISRTESTCKNSHVLQKNTVQKWLDMSHENIYGSKHFPQGCTQTFKIPGPVEDVF